MRIELITPRDPMSLSFLSFPAPEYIDKEKNAIFSQVWVKENSSIVLHSLATDDGKTGVFNGSLKKTKQLNTW